MLVVFPLTCVVRPVTPSLLCQLATLAGDRFPAFTSALLVPRLAAAAAALLATVETAPSWSSVAALPVTAVPLQVVLVRPPTVPAVTDVKVGVSLITMSSPSPAAFARVPMFVVDALASAAPVSPPSTLSVVPRFRCTVVLSFPTKSIPKLVRLLVMVVTVGAAMEVTALFMIVLTSPILAKLVLFPIPDATSVTCRPPALIPLELMTIPPTVTESNTKLLASPKVTVFEVVS